MWPPGASGRVRGFDWSVCNKNCTSGSSRAGPWPARGLDCSVCINNCISGSSRAGSWPARRQNLVRRASGAPPDVVIRGWLGALSPLRGAFFLPGSLPTAVVFRKVGLSKWLWTVDAAHRDPKLEPKFCSRCCAVLFFMCRMRVFMA